MLALALAALAAVLSLTACGSSQSTKKAVIEVGGTPITKAEVEHWIPIEAVVSYNTIPKKPQPAGVLPDPPKYAACIAWLREPLVASSIGQKGFSGAKLKRVCEKHLADLRERVASILMVSAWEKGQAAEEGIKISQGEVEKDVRRFERIETPGAGAFARYLSYSKMKLADAQFIQRITITGTKVSEALLHKPNPQQALAEFTRKWVAKTSCEPGYVIAGCRQYKGSESPP